MKGTIATGIFAIVAAVLAALAPLVWEKFDTPGPKTLYSRIIKTEVSQSLVVEQLASLDLKAFSKKMTVLQVSNIGESDIGQVALDIKLDTDWTNVSSGTRVSKKFFTGDLDLEPSGSASFVARIVRFPADSSIEVFLISDRDFDVLSITPDRDNVIVDDAFLELSRAKPKRSWVHFSLMLTGLALLLGVIWYFRYTKRKVVIRIVPT